MERILTEIERKIPHATKERRQEWAQKLNVDVQALEWPTEGNGALETSTYPIPTLVHTHTFKPRIVIAGKKGMGQLQVASAILDKLASWNFFIQSFDLATLALDSRRSIELAISSIEGVYPFA